MKTAQKPHYKPITQMPHCCVPACLSMILDRRSIAHGTQEDIGVELGLVVSSKNAHLFKKAKVDDSFEGKFGTQVDNQEYSVNNYFYNNNIQLQEKYFPAETIGAIKEFISENLLDGNDLLVCASNEVLYGKGSGHASLIQEIDGENITLVDPGIDKPKIRKVKLDKLVEAMKANKRRGGFWIISSKKREKPKRFIILDQVAKALPWVLLLSLVASRSFTHWDRSTSGYEVTMRFIYVAFCLFIILITSYSIVLYLFRLIKTRNNK